MTVIYAYTREQAIADGILVPFEHYLAQHDADGIRTILQSIAQLEDKFPLGQLLITANACGKLPPPDVLMALSRHAEGDWGTLSIPDWDKNEVGVKEFDQLLSRYLTRDKTHFWIITEADRAATTILLPEDY